MFYETIKNLTHNILHKWKECFSYLLNHEGIEKNVDDYQALGQLF